MPLRLVITYMGYEQDTKMFTAFLDNGCRVVFRLLSRSVPFIFPNSRDNFMCVGLMLRFFLIFKLHWNDVVGVYLPESIFFVTKNVPRRVFA